MPLTHTSLKCGIEDYLNATKLALFLYSIGLICLEEGPAACPLSVSLSSEDIKFRALSMLSKALALSLCREVCFINHFDSMA